MNNFNFNICDGGYCFLNIVDTQNNEFELCIFYDSGKVFPYRVQIMQQADKDIIFEKDYKTQQDFDVELSKKYTMGRTHSCNCN